MKPGSGGAPLRNIGILAHIDAGKTSLTERILYVSGRLREPGAVDAGTTATDFLAVERERGITVKAAVANLEWEGRGEPCRLNLIDTPGHVDFGAEVERSLRALDGAIVVVCAVAGVQSRTESIYRALLREGSARLIFVNKMDRRGASFGRAAGDVARVLDPGALVAQLPWGEGEAFRGVVDLVEMAAYDFLAAGTGAGEGRRPGAERSAGAGPGSSPRPSRARAMPMPIPGELAEEARAARAELVELLASSDESIMETFVAGREPAPGELRRALRSAVVAGRAAPILCGGAFFDEAASLLLDAVVDYLPAPDETEPPEGSEPKTGAAKRLPGGKSSPFSALVFKTGSDPHFGRLSWARLWSGALAPGDKILDARAGRTARVQKLFGIHADRIEALERAEAGDIVAVALGIGGPETAVGATGSTLCDPSAPILYEPISFEEPVVSLAVEARTRADVDRLRAGIAALVDEDPSLRAREDPQTGRIELSGMGELHLEVAVERLSRDFGARIRAGRPQVAFKETITSAAEGREDFDRDLGGERVRALVALRLEPAARGSGLAVRTSLASKAPQSYVEAARRGVESALSVGPAAGLPLEDLAATLVEISGPGGSSATRNGERAVEIAASLAAGKAAREARSIVLEPVMRLEIEVPDDRLGEAAAAISARGGRIEAVEELPGVGKVVVGAAPLRGLFGFAGELRSSTAGKASYSARFNRYEPAPRELRTLI